MRGPERAGLEVSLGRLRPPGRLRPLRVAAVLLALGASGCAAAATGPAGPPVGLGDRLDARLAEPPFDRVQWGILVVDAPSGRAIYERNADLLFIPGSNMKLPVAAAAYGLLGPDYRWQTTLFSHTLPADGVLGGDLYLAAQGDPTLGAPFHPSAREALQALADSLRQAGIRTVEGRLVVDVSAWDSTTVPESWMVEDLMGAAGATGGAFAVAEGEMEIEILGGARAGEPATVQWEPRGPDRGTGGPGADPGQIEPGGSPPALIEHHIETVADDEGASLSVSYLPESRRWIIEGRVVAGERRTLMLSQRDPIRIGVAALARALSETGVELRDGTAILWERDLPVEGECVSGAIPSCAGMLRLAGLPSPTLSAVGVELLGPSQNWLAEQLVRTLGAERGEWGSWAEGFRVAGDHLAETAGVAPEDIHFEDGSGLSNHNLVSPRALVAILGYVRRQSWGSAFRAALAQPGLERTTLSDRLPGMEGRIFAKTGSLSHVNSLSGYLIADDGRELIFSILSNGANLPASQVRERIDDLVREIARSPR